MDWGTRMGSDSESTLPDFLLINNDHSNQHVEGHLEISPGRSSIETMSTTVTTDVQIKEEAVEVSEVFMGRPIDEENNGTIFPTGLILIHYQPTVTLIAPGRQTETHLLSYTTYTPTSTPNNSITRTNNSIIPTNNSEIQFVQKTIRAKYFRGAPLKITAQPIKVVEGETPEEWRRRQKTENAKRARERRLERETPEEKNARLAATTELIRKRLANETPDQRAKRKATQAEIKRKYFANETSDKRIARLAAGAERRRSLLGYKKRIPKCEFEKRHICEECQESFSSISSLQDHVITHARDKNYKCNENDCRKCFTSREGLIIHMITVHTI